jgi:hypothetical protein
LFFLLEYLIINQYHLRHNLIEMELMNQDFLFYLLYNKIDKIHHLLPVKMMIEMLLYHDDLMNQIEPVHMLNILEYLLNQPEFKSKLNHKIRTSLTRNKPI